MKERYMVSYFEGNRPVNKFFPTEAKATDYYEILEEQTQVASLTLEKIITLRKKR